jgi:hypothetical protein
MICPRAPIPPMGDYFRLNTQVKLLRTLGTLFNRRYSTLSDPTISTAIGLKVKDGVVLAVEKLIHSKLLIPEANRRIATIDRHIGMVRGILQLVVFVTNFNHRQHQVC